MTDDYSDIMDKERPQSARGRMPMKERAKIFAPFAALRGFSAAIEKKQRVIVPRRELTEDGKKELDSRLGLLLRELGEGRHPMITVTYYQINRDGTQGSYVQKTGMTVKVDADAGYLQIVNEKIFFVDLLDIDGALWI